MSGHTRTVVVYGASGFVGSAVCVALEERGMRVVAHHAPRLRHDPDYGMEPDLARLAAQQIEILKGLRPDVVVNAGGVADATQSQDTTVHGANVVLPAVLGHAARASSASYIHISTGAVQGEVRVLDSTRTWAPQSEYARSKASGERLLLATMPLGSPMTIYRPPGVHARDLRVTRAMTRYAASALSTTSATERGSPQALLPNVADAVAFLAGARSAPLIVHHPSEGVTNQSLLRMLGGRKPHLISDPFARLAVLSAGTAARTGVVHHRQLIRMLMLGQDQRESWLSGAGWTAPMGRSGWHRLSVDPRHVGA